MHSSETDHMAIVEALLNHNASVDMTSKVRIITPMIR
jgi:hypothetical protein